jgi:nucleoside-diphosphate-sugar epimerase
LHEEKPRSILVTGGRGFLGRAAAKLLQRADYRVISLDRTETETSSNGPILEIVCDITDARQLQSVLQRERVGRILHLAAILPTAAQRDPPLATRVNIQGSINLLEMARQFGIPRFVFGSSLSVYGTGRADHAVSEVERAAPEDVYGAAKLYVEQVGEAYRHSHGLNFVALRIGRVVGPGAQSTTSAWRSQIFEFLSTSRQVEIVVPYRTEETLLLLHVDDAAKMLLTLLEAPSTAHSVYNAPCESFAVADLKHWVEELNRNVRVRTGTRWATGNPRLLDSSRFCHEFRFQGVPIRERLRAAARR